MEQGNGSSEPPPKPDRSPNIKRAFSSPSKTTPEVFTPPRQRLDFSSPSKPKFGSPSLVRREIPSHKQKTDAPSPKFKQSPKKTIDISSSNLQLTKTQEYLNEKNIQTEEKIKSAIEILKTFTDNEEHFKCRGCKNCYAYERLPYILICGHSVCESCIPSSKHCSTCTDKELVGVGQFCPNYDLFNNALILYEVINKIAPTEEGTEMDKYMLYSDATLRKLNTIQDAAKNGLNLGLKVEQDCNIRLTDIKYCLQNLNSMGQKLRIVKNQLQVVNNTEEFCDEMKSAAVTIAAFQKEISRMDWVLAQALTDIKLNKDLVLGISVSAVTLTKEMIHSLSQSEVECYALMTNKEYQPKYSQLTLAGGENRLIMLSFNQAHNTEKNVMVFDYEHLLKGLKSRGVYFSLQFADNSRESIYIDITEESPFTAQVLKLCIGETEGSYKGGKGIVTDRHIVIQTYVRNGEQRYEDILAAVPDVVAEPVKPQPGSVSTGRKFGSEAEIIIHRNAESEPRMCFGKLEFDSVLKKASKGPFTIAESGGIFRTLQ